MHQEIKTSNLIIYSPNNENIEAEVILKDDSVWASQNRIGLYGWLAQDREKMTW